MKTKPLSFPNDLNFEDDEALYRWLTEKQANQRNMTKEQIAYIFGKRYEIEKESHKKSDLTARLPNGRFVPTGKNPTTRERLAEEFNTTASKIRASMEYVRGIDCAEALLPGIREAILNRKIRPTMKAVIAIYKVPESERMAAVLRLDKQTDPRGKKAHTAERETHEQDDFMDFIQKCIRSKKKSRYEYFRCKLNGNEVIQ